MAKSYEELKREIFTITNEVEDGRNTAKRVGGAMDDIVDYTKEVTDIQSEKITELESEDIYIKKVSKDLTQGVELSIEVPMKISEGDVLWCRFETDNGIIGSGIVNFRIDGANSGTAWIDKDNYFTANANGTTIGIQRSSSGIVGNGKISVQFGLVRKDLITRQEFEDSVETQKKNETLYISPNGDDRNNGSAEAPKLTMNSCLENGARKIICEGGIYQQTIDVSLAKYSDVIIVNADANNTVLFKHPNSVVANAANKVSGYNKIYSFVAPAAFAYTSENKWLYQEGVKDHSTEILDGERHPSQRGVAYRCDATKISMCEATSLADALNEIDSSSDYRWYYDSTSRTIYTSAPNKISDANKIRIPSGNFIVGNDESISFRAIGIDVAYMALNLHKFRIATLIDCSAKYVYGGGAISWDSGIVELVRCEAARCVSGKNNGDGFNAHANKTGNAYAKTCCASLIDCWSHDNNDDGYSDHERAECVIRGGLFEYNGKAGITPSYGSHCSCFNVMARQNYSGFFYVGDVADDEGGEGGQLICYNCVAENNRRGGSMLGFGVNGNGNSGIFVQCISKGNDIAYYGAENTSLRLLDCRSSDVRVVKSGKGNIVVDNADIVI